MEIGFGRYFVAGDTGKLVELLARASPINLKLNGRC